MKATIGSKFAHIQWFVLVHVDVDLFDVGYPIVHFTPILYVFNDPSQALLEAW